MSKPIAKPDRRLNRLTEKVLELAEHYAGLSDADLAATTQVLRARLDDGESLDDVRAEAFAAVREAARRELGLTAFRVQVYAGAVLATGAVAEMRTGEGKTLTATLPVYLHALAGPVDVVTANAYLATRDAAWMGPVYARLGLTCTAVVAGQSRADKQAAYGCDVIYSTANELGFDWLRDRLATSRDAQVATARRQAFALIDECDQVLIDEARTPLIISGLATPPGDVLAEVDAAVAGLEVGRTDETTRTETGHVIVDRAEGTVHLTEAGLARVEADLAIDDLYAHPDLTYRVHAALEAHTLAHLDRDYVIEDGAVLIVDTATGRTMHGRRFGKGLHEALEAKHGLEVQPEVRTQAMITVQNFFGLYERLSGMTGTAAEATEEFAQIYQLAVHVIPTNVPIARIDHDDVVFLTREAKLTAVVDTIRTHQQAGQPVLAGATSVAGAEELSMLLDKAGIDHELLTARDPAREADIIAQAGRPGAVTVATNMAGRGTDILLGGDPDRLARTAVAAALDGMDEGADADEADALTERITRETTAQVAADRARVIEAGGLYVLGTERHASRRIDNQLRGRAGRQGEPGASVFHLSLQDDLLAVFSDTPLEWALTRLSERGDKDAMDTLDVDDPTAAIAHLDGAEAPIHHPMVGKAVITAQRRLEELHASVRSHVKQFDDVITGQRAAVYNHREELLDMSDEDLVARAAQRVTEAIDALCDRQVPADSDPRDWDLDVLAADCSRLGLGTTALRDAITDGRVVEGDQVRMLLHRGGAGLLARRTDEAGEHWPVVVRALLLKALDEHWVDLIGDLEAIKDAIGLRAKANLDPLTEFRRECYRRFETFADEVAFDQAAGVLHTPVRMRTPA